MAYKVFQNGFPLNASELNNYLMNQSVMVFATATARDTDLTAPLEGMIVWLQDSNKFVYYTGSAWTDVIVPPIADVAGKNKIINGAFDIWQRGTSFTPSSPSYLADRWTTEFNGSGATRTISQQTFTPGTAPVSGYEGQYFLRYAQSVAGSGGTYNQLLQRIEDVRNFAGQTVTFSFWAKGATAFTITPRYLRSFGTGGSSGDEANFGSAITLTTSWTRYSATVTLPSVSGKTIGAGSFVSMALDLPQNSTFTFDIWGVQLEAGSSATSFARAAATLQGELAACQRYYARWGGDSIYEYFGNAIGESTTLADALVKMPVQMRTTPSSVEYSTTRISSQTGNDVAITSLTLTATASSSKAARLVLTAAGSITANRPYFFGTNNSTSAYLALSAEL